MKRKQNTPNTLGRNTRTSTVRVYPHDGIPVPDMPGAWQMRSGTGVYTTTLSGTIIRVGNVGRKS